jgi:hypothetical protein
MAAAYDLSLSVVMRFGGDALRCEVLLLQQLSQQSPCRSSAASTLDQGVKHFAFIVDRPPEPVFSITDLDDHFVDMPASTGTRTAAAKIAGDQPSKLQKPAPDGLVWNVDATLCKQIFDISVAKWKTKIQPDGILDYNGWKSVSGIRYFLHPSILIRNPYCGH